MSFAELAEKVAADFRATMEQEGFETFNDMASCYWWDSADIKDEVDAILRGLDVDAYIDEIDRSSVICEGQAMDYRAFAKLWRSALAKS